MASVPSVDHLLQDIPHETLSQPCKDRHLCDIALRIKEWRSIAPYLRLTEVDDKEIRTKFPEELRAQNIAMLRRWREKRGKKATYKKLAEVFWKIANLSLVEVVVDILKNESSSSESEGEVEQSGAGQKWSVAKYAEFLRSRYHTTRPPVLSLQWPPPPTHTIFNLALVQKQRLEHGPDEELVRLLQRGQVSEVVESQSEIELHNLMTADNMGRKVIVIEGAPGSGKSTLAWHVCQQWGKGELFTEYDVVVFVQLRDPKLQMAQTLADIFSVHSCDMGNALVPLITQHNKWGKGVLLVLDGWDELRHDCTAYSLLMQLIQIPDYLGMHNGSLIITSRPVTSAELQPHASSRVEILGFKPEEVKEYFKDCFQEKKKLDMLPTFYEQLQQRPVIEASCFLPLNAVIVVHIFFSCGFNLPHTLHGVFEKLVLSCVVRHVSAREPAEVPITASCLDELPPIIYDKLEQLCCLAFHGIWINKVVFSTSDLKIFSLLHDLSHTLSLIQLVESYQSVRCGRSYHFFHLQIQELLAAYHISKLDEEKQVRLFRDSFGQPRFTAVIHFYAAFTKLESVQIQELLLDMLKKRSYHGNVLQCVFEAQQPSLCQRIGYSILSLTSKNCTPPLSLLMLSSPLNCISLGFFLCRFCFLCNDFFTQHNESV